MAAQADMYLLYTDETNVDPTKSEFFVYGGVAVPVNQAQALSNKIEALRLKYGYKPQDLLKFNTVEKPRYISADDHLNIKRHVMLEAARSDVRLFASMILHNVAVGVDEARRNEINRICLNFDSFLRRERDSGLVLVDRFRDPKLIEHLQEKFQVGLVGLPYSKYFRLKNILGFHTAAIGTSHFSSLVDIVLGGLRYIINGRAVPDSEKVLKVLAQQICKLCPKNDSGRILESSLFFSPKTIRLMSYLEKYKRLQRDLSSYGMPTAQKLGT